MKVNSYHTRMLLIEKLSAQSGLQSLSENLLKNDSKNGETNGTIRSASNGMASRTLGSSDTTEPNTSEKVTISDVAMKKSQEEMTAEDRLPAHIKRLKALIKEIKIQIKEQQQKLAELEQSNVSNDVKNATRELYLEQLMSLQSALVSTSSALEQAIEAAGITDPAVLMAAVL